MCSLSWQIICVLFAMSILQMVGQLGLTKGHGEDKKVRSPTGAVMHG